MTDAHEGQNEMTLAEWATNDTRPNELPIVDDWRSDDIDSWLTDLRESLRQTGAAARRVSTEAQQVSLYAVAASVEAERTPGYDEDGWPRPLRFRGGRGGRIVTQPQRTTYDTPIGPIDERNQHSIYSATCYFDGRTDVDEATIRALLLNKEDMHELFPCPCGTWNTVYGSYNLRTPGGSAARHCTTCAMAAFEKTTHKFCDDCRSYLPVSYATRFNTSWACFDCIGSLSTEQVEALAWCEKCRVRYDSITHADLHDHRDRSAKCCDEREVEFSIALADGSRLSAEAIHSMTHEKEVLSDDGVRAVHRVLSAAHFARLDPASARFDPEYRDRANRDRANLAYADHSFFNEQGPAWKTDRGTLPKRLRSFVFKTMQVRLTDAEVAEIGTAAYTHSRPYSLDVAITRRLNQDRSEFANSGSCWWSEYAESRCTLKSNGGFAVRSFDEKGRVSGRFWVLPLAEKDNVHHLCPTFGDAQAYLVFNGYGELSESRLPVVMMNLTGWTSESVGFCPIDEVMYVNSECAHLIAPADRIEEFKGRISEDLRQHATPSHLA